MTARRWWLIVALGLAAGCASSAGAPPSRPAAPVADSPPPASREIEALTRRMDALGSRSNDLENAIARVGARVEGLERRLDQLAAQIAHARASTAPSAAGGDPAFAVPAPGTPRPATEPREGARAPGNSPPTARDLYQEAMAKHKAGEPGQAVLIFYDLIARYPMDPLRESAQFQVGEIYFREREFREALREFEDLLAAVPSGAKTAEALLKMGLAHRALGDEGAARRSWERLTREFPPSAASRQARALLRTPRPR